jgi:hypothetical protein
MQQRHIGNSSTIDNSITTPSGLVEVIIMEERTLKDMEGFEMGEICGMEGGGIPQQGMNLIALLQKLLQHIVSQQSVAA